MQLHYGILQKPNSPAWKRAKVVVAMLLLQFTALTTVPKFGLSAVIVTTPLPKHGMAEHSSAPTTQLAPHLLSGLDIPNGSRRCGRASLTA